MKMVKISVYSVGMYITGEVGVAGLIKYIYS